jgi:DNA-binding CsgD family transcriptional regulator
MIKSINEFIKEVALKLSEQPFTGRDNADIHKFPLNSKQCLYIIDWQSSTVVYQKQISDVLGYNEGEFNLETILSIAHPDDLSLIKRITQAVVNHLLNYTWDPSSQEVPTLNISYRFRKKDGSYIKILRQSTLYEKTETGLMKSNLSLLTDISFFDTSDSINWEFIAPKIEQDVFRNEIYKEFNHFFTKREIDVIQLIHENYITKSIAEKLFISEHTAYSHRKNILRKSNCHNSKQLVEFCKKIGIL